MRGGTSRALFFKDTDLPSQPERWKEIFLSALGSPDSTGRQVDGLGGGGSSTSKVAVISSLEDPRYDVSYYFGQVAVDQPSVDFVGNCGNISSAVAPFAIDEGLVPGIEPTTVVRIHQRNTDKLIIAEVNVVDGRFDESGDYRIPGISGTGSRVTLHFIDPGGSLTGSLLPTGNVIDNLQHIKEIGDVQCSIVDAGNPFVFVKAVDLCIDVKDLAQFDKVQTAAVLESIRARAAVMLGLAEDDKKASIYSQAVPKIAVVSPAETYQTMDGKMVEGSDNDLLIRCISMGRLHKAMPGTAAICAAGAVKIEGTVVSQVAESDTSRSKVRFGHPSGVMDTCSKVEQRGGHIHYRQATFFRTARRIMEGNILVPTVR